MSPTGELISTKHDCLMSLEFCAVMQFYFTQLIRPPARRTRRHPAISCQMFGMSATWKCV